MEKARQFLFGSMILAIFMMVATATTAQTTKEEFMSKWMNSKQFTLDVLDKMPDSGMDYKTDPEAMSFKEQIHHIANSIVGNNVSRRQIMALIMDHSTHHRGSAIAYLRAEGVEPPAFVGF